MEGDTRSILGLLFVLLWAVKRDTTEEAAQVTKTPSASSLSSAATTSSANSAAFSSTTADAASARRPSKGSIFHQMRSSSSTPQRLESPPSSPSMARSHDAQFKFDVKDTPNLKNSVGWYEGAKMDVTTLQEPLSEIVTTEVVSVSYESTLDVASDLDSGTNAETESDSTDVPAIPESRFSLEIAKSKALSSALSGDLEPKSEPVVARTESLKKSDSVREPTAVTGDNLKPEQTRSTEFGRTKSGKAKALPAIPPSPRSQSIGSPRYQTLPNPSPRSQSSPRKPAASPRSRIMNAENDALSRANSSNQGLDISTARPADLSQRSQSSPRPLPPPKKQEKDASPITISTVPSKSPVAEELLVDDKKKRRGSRAPKKEGEESMRDSKSSKSGKRSAHKNTTRRDRKSLLVVSPSEENSRESDDEASEGSCNARPASLDSGASPSVPSSPAGPASPSGPTSPAGPASPDSTASPASNTGVGETKSEPDLAATPTKFPPTRKKRMETLGAMGREVLLEQIRNRSPSHVRKDSKQRSKSEQRRSRKSDPIELRESEHVLPNELTLSRKRTKRRPQSASFFAENETFVLRLQAMCRGCLARRNFRTIVKEARDKEYASTIAAFSENPTPLLRVQAVIRGALWRKYPPRFIKENQTRKSIVQEVLQTEEVYVSCLHYLNTTYYKILSQMSPDHIEFSKLRTIFSSAQIIEGFNTRLLVSLRARVEKWSNSSLISDIFLKIVDFMKLYTTYVNYYDEVSRIIEQASVHPEVFSALAAGRDDPTNPKRLDLMSMLIMPIQRLPRYVLLIKELLAHTPEDHPDLAELATLFTKLSTVTSYINQKKREMENYRTVSAISEKLQGYDQEKFGALINPARMFIKQGQLGLLDIQEPVDTQSIDEKIKNIETLRSFSTRYVFLFTDMILATKTELTDKTLFEKKFGALSIQNSIYSANELRDLATTFRYSNGLDLHRYQLLNVESTSGHFLFALTCREKSQDGNFFVFAAPDKEAKLAWMREIDSALWSLLDNRRKKLTFDLVAEKAVSIKSPFKATTGYLYINLDGIPGTWVRKFVAVQGSKIFLSAHEQAYCENRVEQEIQTLNLEEILFWPIPNRINFMDYEDEETRENRRFCFCAKKKRVGESWSTIYFASADLTKLTEWINAIRNSLTAHLDDLESR
eukprot:TRINITY_DN4401_c0_g1_i1.p1 TRINITY_DN4401_c0_g1~~TRINITY_DN4401_c0_g1_i1.p1  ORF type:complete len:1275 (-),score=238.87 TRINITY_DN4401_c0_g1_i1:139-3642(-)